jgi:hypothetical protein
VRGLSNPGKGILPIGTPHPAFARSGHCSAFFIASPRTSGKGRALKVKVMTQLGILEVGDARSNVFYKIGSCASDGIIHGILHGSVFSLINPMLFSGPTSLHGDNGWKLQLLITHWNHRGATFIGHH